jgi:hypothetical protein
MCFTNTMPLFSKEFCSRTSLESGDVITPPCCKKNFTTKKRWEKTSKYNSKQQNKMVASRPPSPPVVAAAVGAVCLVKRKDDERSFCGADGGTRHQIHTPRAFLRRWIFRVCACSLVLAGRYLLVALLIVDSFCPAALPRSKRDVGYIQIRTSRIRRTRNFPTNNNAPLLCCVCKWMWVLTIPEIPILHCDPHSKIPLSKLSRILVLYQGTLVGPP